jgi:hypothetical protein
MLRNGGPNFFSLGDELSQETEMQRMGSFQASLIATVHLAGQNTGMGERNNDGL